MIAKTNVYNAMVLIKDVLETRREAERTSIRERLPAKIDKLKEIYSGTGVVRKLQAIESAVDKLIEDRPSTHEVRREEKKQYYEKNREAISN